MKTVKVILLWVCIISMLVPPIVWAVSSKMQAYYKAQIDDFSKSNLEIKDIIAKKAFWARIGESPIQYSFIVSALSAITLVGLTIKNKQKAGL